MSEITAANDTDEDDDDLEEVGPGTFTCHEAFTMAGNLADRIAQELCLHPTIASNPDWLAAAANAEMMLRELYEDIALVHLDDDDTEVEGSALQ